MIAHIFRVTGVRFGPKGGPKILWAAYNGTTRKLIHDAPSRHILLSEMWNQKRFKSVTKWISYGGVFTTEQVETILRERRWRTLPISAQNDFSQSFVDYGYIFERGRE